MLRVFGVCQVILTIRDDPEKWYTSYVNSLLWLYRTWWFKPFSWVLPMGQKLDVRAYPLPCQSFLRFAAISLLVLHAWCC